ncbi:tape measure protein [Microbacterium sufflavum]|uniref:Tape measure protein n=1 Tax=Microbacterium sufflavum TaxID=2851649 RepID=A0ABY4IBN4_9MICO|nr:tape measure protein [Microbacterium sufflavum]UPL09974.1 tape measure protein [Microbacterium sufflavum]
MAFGLFGGAVVAQEIGVAYVSLLPSGAGFSKAVDKEAQQAFSGAEKRSTGFFASLRSGVGKVVGGVGLLAGTVGAIALGGGISRALNIEDATAKLKGLGHDTQAVEAIMKDALASVKGTAFGLDAAATTAASAVAAGIKPGQELERYLRLTADAATIAGTSMEEMGSIINQVTSKGYAGMENLNRLTERGIPILQWLADEYGVTADELQKMVSRGEVDAATFRKVIEDNIGGAALASGETTRGSLANLGAALSRLGEAFAGPVLGLAKDFFGELTTIADGITSRVQPVVEKLQVTLDGIDFQFSDSVLSTLDRVVAGFSELKGTFAGMEGLTPILATLAGAMAPLLSALPIIGRFLPAISGPVGAVIGLLAGMVIESDALQSALLGLGETFKPLGAVLQELGTTIGPVVASVFAELGDQLAEVVPLISETLVDAISQLLPPLSELLISLLPLLPPLIDLVIGVLPVFTELLSFLIPIVAAIAQGIADWLTIFTALQTAFAGDTTFDDFVATLYSVIGPVGDLWRSVYEAAEQVYAALTWIDGVWRATFGQITAVLTGAYRNISTTASSIWSTLTSVFSGGVSTVVGIFANFPRSIQSLFSGVGSWLVSSGRALIRGFIDGINSMVGAVGDAIGGVLEWASGFFPHSPAKRGPFSGQGWTAVFDGGESLMEQFALGAERFRPELSFSNFTTLASIQGAVAPGDIYVQNPFTADYLLAEVESAADRRIGAYDDRRAFATRGGRRQ